MSRPLLIVSRDSFRFFGPMPRPEGMIKAYLGKFLNIIFINLIIRDVCINFMIFPSAGLFSLQKDAMIDLDSMS